MYILLIFLIIAIIFFYNIEPFDETGLIFGALGDKYYDLKGELLNTRPIEDCLNDDYYCYTNTTFYKSHL